MKELEEAMRLSSEDVTLSSAEIVPCQTSASGMDKIRIDVTIRVGKGFFFQNSKVDYKTGMTKTSSTLNDLHLPRIWIC